MKVIVSRNLWYSQRKLRLVSPVAACTFVGNLCTAIDSCWSTTLDRGKLTVTLIKRLATPLY